LSERGQDIIGSKMEAKSWRFRIVHHIKKEKKGERQRKINT